jgi:hypothetical protein
MSIVADAHRFIKAAEVHHNAEFGDAICNKKEKEMLELAVKYFMTKEEPEFYRLLFQCDSCIAKILAASYCEQIRYDLQAALFLLERSKSEKWAFSDNPKKQSGVLCGIDNTMRYIKKSIIKQQNFSNDRLFRQIAMYEFLLAAYFEAWVGFKSIKAQENWNNLISFVRQIIADKNHEQFFSEIFENAQNFQKLFTALVGIELNCCASKCLTMVNNLVIGNALNPRMLKFAEAQLEKIQKGIPLNGQ